MAPVARWSLLSNSAALARSSHGVAAVGSRVFVHGGELKPRTPVDEGNPGSVHSVSLADPLNGSPISTLVASKSAVPSPRVGATLVGVDDKLYLWGGRGGVDMSPLHGESAGMFVGSPKADIIEWSQVGSPDDPNAPEPRSYHAAVSHEGKIYIHAGCPTSGRLATLHAFDPTTNVWKALASAPDPPRGGTALAATARGLLRFGGFAGHELGALDVYAPASDTWATLAPAPDPAHGAPEARSVAGFVSFRTAAAPDALALLWHGERTPSSAGHAGAGAFWEDVWLLKTAGHGLAWQKLPVTGARTPEGRGWFQPACVPGEPSDRAVMFGGLLSSNERSGEMWVLEVVDASTSS